MKKDTKKQSKESKGMERARGDHRRISKMSSEQKRFTALLAVGGIVLLVVLSNAIYMGYRVRLLNNQLAYLLDNNSILQEEVSDLKTTFAATLEEENSTIETYSIELDAFDFATKTYKVNIKVVPKEFTEETETVIYFGIKDYPLELKDHAFVGQAVLPLDASYDGNVTVLFTNGEKKNTEVLKNYKGIPHLLDKVLLASLDKFPEYVDGKLKLAGDLQYQLDGNDYFYFSSLKLVVKSNDMIVSTTDIGENFFNGEESVQHDTESLENPDLMDITQQTVDTTKEGKEKADTDKKEDGTQDTFVDDPNAFQKMSGKYHLKDEIDIVPETNVTIYLEAISKQGYAFQYTIFNGTATALEQENPKHKGWADAKEYIPYTYKILDEKAQIITWK